MIILDSDHLSILQQPRSPQFDRVVAAMNSSFDTDFATTAVSLDEQMRGWLAAINRAKSVQHQVRYYERLVKMVDFYSRWSIVPFNDSAADLFTAFRKQGIRISTMDLKIASITVTFGALLLSANLRDFEQVPELRVENWLR